ncbi:hypothetical protein A6A06_22510 [Streptomyces sp. CB02923]|uniref:DUF1906 domain-containing protein n=1 Tax=Streptomyces sp. CB02923 TaxID=1718985 RepID=UPI00093B58A4|nr:DUF1906 domain-containing protein [Streptomyces sp. CB02923]OKH99836.1 hypothetical protein A6A06_22510 [Streptomyces sp. CB02923]
MGSTKRIIRRRAPRPAALLTALTGLLGLLATVLAPAAGAEPDRTGPRGPNVFRGWAFDTCKAPPQSTLQAWKGSKYRGIGIYFGGRGRACPSQPNLTPGWVRAAHRAGWRMLPLYVGSQAPCVVNKSKRKATIGGDPAQVGASEARDAVRRAKALGIAPDSALYLDMEAYSLRNAPCTRKTLDYIRAWNRETSRQGYVPGFYSSADSGVRHMERARQAGAQDLPSVMWFARWHSKPNLYGEPELSGKAWRPHRRIHQYAGNVAESHGGRRLVIDRNQVDAPVAVIE